MELNLYLSYDVIPFIILNCLNYSRIYVILMVSQSNIVPLFFSMLELPNPTSFPNLPNYPPFSFPKQTPFDLCIQHFVISKY